VPLEVERWRAFSTATVSDALDRLGISGQCYGIKPLEGAFRVLGRAHTVRYVPVGSVKGNVGDYIDDVAPGDVVVLDNGGIQDATVWGDILTSVAHRRGIAGTVIHGVCRDSARSLELGYPIFSRGHYMRTGKDRVQADAFNVSVSLGQVRVEPGDILFGDRDGLLVVPKLREDEVHSAALAIEESEDRIRDSVARGERLDEARRRFGYFSLQRRGDGK
jgi:4-hydroxy-4-methyl-2-oxoglutarate aldolase